MIETATGPIKAEALGRTLMHEHVFMVSHEMSENHPEFCPFDEKLEIERAVERLNRLHASGIDSVVDCTVMGLGLRAHLVAEVAKRTPVNILMSTGFYCLDSLPFSLGLRGPGLMSDEPEPLDVLFLKDYNEGIANTGIKPAIIKCATDKKGLTKDVIRVLNASGRTHLTTGLPITTHTSAYHKVGLLQQDTFEALGVPLDRVVIGHSGDTTDLDYLQKMIDRGSYLGMDRFGLNFGITAKQRVDTVVALCERGVADRLVLSHDACCFIDAIDKKKLEAITPDWHYEHIPKDIVPQLLQQGVTQAQIDMMLVETPRKILAAASS